MVYRGWWWPKFGPISTVNSSVFSNFFTENSRSNFLAHLNWKLKWDLLITCHPASVPPSLCKLFTFTTFPQEPLGQFQPNLAQSILGSRRLKVLQIRTIKFSKKIIGFYLSLSMLWYNHSSSQMCLLIENKNSSGIQDRCYLKKFFKIISNLLSQLLKFTQTIRMRHNPRHLQCRTIRSIIEKRITQITAPKSLTRSSIYFPCSHVHLLLCRSVFSDLKGLSP